MSQNLRNLLFIIAAAAIAALVMATPPCDAGDGESMCAVISEAN